MPSRESALPGTMARGLTGSGFAPIDAALRGPKWARAVFRDPRFEPTLRLQTCRSPAPQPGEWHVVAAVGQQEGAILSHFSEKSEDANDQAP